MTNGMILNLILLICCSLMLMSLAVPLMVYVPVYLKIFALPEHLRVLMTSIIVTKVLTAKTLKKGYWYHKLRKAFSKFYRRHFELIKLLQQDISNSEFCGDLIYKFKKIIGNQKVSDLFKHYFNRLKRAWYT